MKNVYEVKKDTVYKLTDKVRVYDEARRRGCHYYDTHGYLAVKNNTSFTEYVKSGKDKGYFIYTDSSDVVRIMFDVSYSPLIIKGLYTNNELVVYCDDVHSINLLSEIAEDLSIIPTFAMSEQTIKSIGYKKVNDVILIDKKPDSFSIKLTNTIDRVNGEYIIDFNNGRMIEARINDYIVICDSITVPNALSLLSLGLDVKVTIHKLNDSRIKTLLEAGFTQRDEVFTFKHKKIKTKVEDINNLLNNAYTLNSEVLPGSLRFTSRLIVKEDSKSTYAFTNLLALMSEKPVDSKEVNDVYYKAIVATTKNIVKYMGKLPISLNNEHWMYSKELPSNEDVQLITDNDVELLKVEDGLVKYNPSVFYIGR